MRKSWSITLGIVLVLICVGASGCRAGTGQSEDVNLKRQVQLEKRLDDLLVLQARHQNFKIVEKEISLQSIEFFETGAEAEYLFRMTFVLNAATPEELPLMRGMLKYLEENRTSLSPETLREVEEYIAFWDAAIREDLGILQEADAVLRIKAEFDRQDTIKDESVRVYKQNDVGEYLPIRLQSEEDLMNQGYGMVKGIMDPKN